MAINRRFQRFGDDNRSRSRNRVEELDRTINQLIQARNQVSGGGGTRSRSRNQDNLQLADNIPTIEPPPPAEWDEDDPTAPSGPPNLEPAPPEDINDGNIGDQPKTIYKKFDFDRDVINVQRIGEEELFYPKKAVAKPFTNAEGYVVEEVPADSEFPNYNSDVYYLEKTNSTIAYLSTMRGISASYAESSGSGMTYRYMTKLTTTEDDGVYPVNDSINPATSSEELDIISIAREFYKDGIDPEFFGLTIDVSADSIDETTNYGPSLDNGTDGLVGLFPYSEEHTTNIGTKYFLYRYTSGEYYNKTTDAFTMPDKDNLDTSAGPLGEVYTDAGIVVLFLDKISALYGNFDMRNKSLDYLASIGGNSHVSLNSNIYYARLGNEEFNYTNNRTFYEEDNPNVVKSEFRNNPRTFPTIVGFYNNKNELVAVGKISKPFEKNAQEEALIRAELSY